MFGRFGWAEILLIVVLVMILFGSAKIPSIMKNLADGINVFKKEMKKKRLRQRRRLPRKSQLKKWPQKGNKKIIYNII